MLCFVNVDCPCVRVTVLPTARYDIRVRTDWVRKDIHDGENGPPFASQFDSMRFGSTASIPSGLKRCTVGSRRSGTGSTTWWESCHCRPSRYLTISEPTLAGSTCTCCPPAAPPLRHSFLPAPSISCASPSPALCPSIAMYRGCAFCGRWACARVLPLLLADGWSAVAATA